jgi:hypothetical protein
MTEAGIAAGEQGPSRSECWCCGTNQLSEQMVHLGNRPEVALCLRCAHFVHKQAGGIEDRTRTGPLVTARGRLRQARRNVIQKGWHRHPLVGRPLRWLGRYMP